MKLPRRAILQLAPGVAALPVLLPVAKAQTYPSRPITICRAVSGGRPTDALARILAEHMRTTLGQPLIIENVSGTAGSIDVGRIARAAPDGYTVTIGHWQTGYSLTRSADARSSCRASEGRDREMVGRS